MKKSAKLRSMVVVAIDTQATHNTAIEWNTKQTYVWLASNVCRVIQIFLKLIAK